MAGEVNPTFDTPLSAEKPSQAHLAKQMIKLCQPHAWSIAGIFVMQTLQLLASVAALAFLGTGIDHLKAWASGLPLPKAWPMGLSIEIPGPLWSSILFAAGMMVAFSVLRAILSTYATVALALVMHRHLIPDLQKRVFHRLQQLSFRFFDLQHSGAIINRVTGDIQSVRSFVESVLLETLTLGLTSSIYAIYMLNVEPWLALACMSPFPVMMLVAIRFSRAVRPRYLESRRRFDQMVLSLSENAQGAYFIRGFVLESEAERRFAERNDAVQDSQSEIFRRVSVFAPTLNMLNHCSLIILLFYGGWLVIRGNLALGSGFVVFASLLQQLSNQISSLSQVITSIQESLSGAERVFQILEADPGLKSPSLPKRSGRVEGRVRFEGVTFHYHPKRSALQEISFEAEPGETVAIVGETGAGKSALLSLIPRFYDPTSGQVLIDNVSARDWDLVDLRKQVGIVFQEPFVFSLSIAENIRLGSEDSDMAAIERAARLARAHDFIMEKEDGYDTVLEESGSNLSGGQRQRLALARALVANPAILLLDDPTSAVDSETEHEIFAAMDEAMASRTTFIIAHRLSTLQRADRILVLKSGRLVDQGTHADLMARQGLYREAAAIQLQENLTGRSSEGRAIG